MRKRLFTSSVGVDHLAFATLGVFGLYNGQKLVADIVASNTSYIWFSAVCLLVTVVCAVLWSWDSRREHKRDLAASYSRGRSVGFQEGVAVPRLLDIRENRTT